VQQLPHGLRQRHAQVVHVAHLRRHHSAVRTQKLVVDGTCEER
jgi:hypothetical protein